MSKILATSLMAFAAIVMTCPNAQASLTGDPLPPTPGEVWVATANHTTYVSTNLANYNTATDASNPSARPYVTLESATQDSITLNFVYDGPVGHFFEYRVDNEPPTATAHLIIDNAFRYDGFWITPAGSPYQHTFTGVQNYVDVRVALGAEQDWYFDWVRFSVAPVPEPTTFVVWSLLGVCAMSMRRGRHEA